MKKKKKKNITIYSKFNKYKQLPEREIYIIGTECYKKQATWSNGNMEDTVHKINGITSWSKGRINII